MSGRARLAKADRRRHARYIARRDRLRSDQNPLVALTSDEWWASLERAVWCDSEVALLRAIVEFDRAHPQPVPYARGYHRKHRSSR